MTETSPVPLFEDRSAAKAIAAIKGTIENRLASIIPAANIWPPRLHEAERHALLSPGKRFRPLLCVFIADAGAAKSADIRAAAIDVGCVAEMVHAASLILDDLPCMDDAALRRNQPSTHIQFDESTAILSATALLNRAFSVLARLQGVSAEVKIELVDMLSFAVGSKGLIAGQMADLANTDTNVSVAEIERFNALKTGALFDFSVDAAAVLSGISGARRAALKDFSHHLGLAFQLMDDVKDSVLSESEAEKSVGRDIGKATILALSGSEAAMTRLGGYIDVAIDALGRAELSGIDTLTAVIEAQFAFLNR